jgi:hypothetical protein
VIQKLHQALAPEGAAFVAITSLLSRERTVDQIAEAGLTVDVVSWELQDLPPEFLSQREHLARIEQLSDAHTLSIGDDVVLVTYLLEVRHSTSRNAPSGFPFDPPL